MGNGKFHHGLGRVRARWTGRGWVRVRVSGRASPGLLPRNSRASYLRGVGYEKGRGRGREVEMARVLGVLMSGGWGMVNEMASALVNVLVILLESVSENVRESGQASGKGSARESEENVVVEKVVQASESWPRHDPLVRVRVARGWVGMVR